MTLRQKIKARIKELKSDTRHKQKPALVEINAPLALIQVDISAKISALEWVLRILKEDTPRKICKKCKEFFSRFQCGKNIGEGECDCPKCQGYCTCKD